LVACPGTSIDSHGARFLEDALGKTSSYVLRPNVRMNIEAFHLADVVVDRSQRGATRRPVSIPSQQQAASWRRVLRRQGDEFCLETLEPKVDPQSFGVLAEQQAYDRQVRRQVSGSDIEHAVALRDRALHAAAGNPANGVPCCRSSLSGQNFMARNSSPERQTTR